MARRSGLGRGLGALIPSDVTTPAGEEGSAYREVPLSSVIVNRYQPREHFDEESLDGLTESVREMGVLQPILVRENDDGFELIAGERRWRAAKRAGLQTIPVIVRNVEDMGSLEQALVENLHRQDLNALEEAAGYQQLIEEFGLTQEEASKRVGKSRSTVANMLRLFHLPPSVQRLIGEGTLSAGHARAILGTPDRAYQEALARRVVADQLSVRQVEELVRVRQQLEEATAPSAPSSATEAPLKAPGILEFERLMSDQLDTKVSVAMSARRGKVVIEFADLADLERIYRIIGPQEPST